jgi:hypothetical protein
MGKKRKGDATPHHKWQEKLKAVKLFIKSATAWIVFISALIALIKLLINGG